MHGVVVPLQHRLAATAPVFRGPASCGARFGNDVNGKIVWRVLRRCRGRRYGSWELEVRSWKCHGVALRRR